LERAIINLERPVTSNAGVVTGSEKQPPVSTTAKGDYYSLEILDRMVVMKDNGNLFFDEIATCYNNAGLKAFSVKGNGTE
jgi:hypothetical protein